MAFSKNHQGAIRSLMIFTIFRLFRLCPENLRFRCQNSGAFSPIELKQGEDDGNRKRYKKGA